MEHKEIRYSILDPTGNITALVESKVEISRQPLVAEEIMKSHPEVEQVGFVRFPENREDHSEAGENVALRMAGGEFCGNAAMSAAALYLLQSKADGGDNAAGGARLVRGPVSAVSQGTYLLTHLAGESEDTSPDSPPGIADRRVLVKVSGAEKPVEVKLWRETELSFRAGVHMPDALAIEEMEFSFGNVTGMLPVVRMEGISHIIIEHNSAFFALKDKRRDAEQAVKKWCEELKADGLGLMFLEVGRLTPLVYIPGSGTVFWENSCASGTSAAGMYLAHKAGGRAAQSLQEPGGELYVESDPLGQGTWLYGRVCLIDRRI